MKRRHKTNNQAGEVDFNNLPRHIAIIMDGNGRWAKRRGLPRTSGHSAGAENFRTIATYCKDIGIQYLTVYAFSTENWRRPPEEVSTIMGLLDKYLHEAIERMERDRVKMKFFGDTSVLSPKLRALIERTAEISSQYEGCQVNICVNYGGRDEIIRAAKRLAETGVAFSEENFAGEMYSAGIPDPDMIIRPGGEMRISNFLLWQAAYSELYFTDTLWPDFSKDELNKAIFSFQHRDRRFGGI
ncbi:MAG: di-trans,poly-cis-decaprenylcistransferase [Clostridiales bacterium]|nr:di-trans,poly-cis-decaprenylcistransferase [Clostridiales bacterium]